MYGEDLDWAKRIKDAGWEVWYNGQVEITHVKEAASRQSSKSRIDFYEAMWIFYDKHYRQETNGWLDKMIVLGIVMKGGADVARHLWEFTRHGPGSSASGHPARKQATAAFIAAPAAPTASDPTIAVGADQ
jgi:GT2 family glycosyltransferase